MCADILGDGKLHERVMVVRRADPCCQSPVRSSAKKPGGTRVALAQAGGFPLVPFKHSKLVVGGLLIAAAMGYVAAAVARAGWVYYLPLDDYTRQPGLAGRRVRIAGTASAIRVSDGLVD